MAYARVFQSGTSQAVRLPKDFRIQAERVEMFRRGKEIVLREVPLGEETVFDLLASLPDDFLAEGRQDEAPQEREAL